MKQYLMFSAIVLMSCVSGNAKSASIDAILEAKKRADDAASKLPPISSSASSTSSVPSRASGAGKDRILEQLQETIDEESLRDLRDRTRAP